MEEPESSFEPDILHPDILHPEMLSKETILKLLRDRQVKVDNEDAADMGFLVDLFRRTLMPLPQRVPRNNRKGTRTKAWIKRIDAQKPKLEETAVEHQNPKRTTSPKKGLHISSDLYLTPESRITYSDSSPTTKKLVSPKKQKSKKRSYITLNEDTNSKPKSSESGSSKRSISTAGMDAVRKALGTSTEEKRKEKVKKEKSALKRNAVGSAIFVLFCLALFCLFVLWFFGFDFEV